MTPLEELTADIREKLPRLIETQRLYYLNGFEDVTVKKDPMLNDVLEWYDKHANILRNRSFDKHKAWIEWDLSKPYLKDQSPELIKYLHRLIKPLKTNQ
ncbi:hypothetical protein ACMGDK_11260 [Chryseobacterium sp. DT-3]|uniref:hypothetical protein n=1 Tax=Chryseobacterium sp. DT-3 TaxID=3396164 RepID=UPI003F1D3724